MCGENKAPDYRTAAEGGSPPRVRGKRPLGLVHAESPRITPACAGKTPCLGVHESQRMDHPRVCGENAFSRLSLFHQYGSPPRVRGKQRGLYTDQDAKRITPACAGKTSLSRIFLLATTDHPRVCGENVTSGLGNTMKAGSPPRVRGKQCSPQRPPS